MLRIRNPNYISLKAIKSQGKRNERTRKIYKYSPQREITSSFTTVIIHYDRNKFTREKSHHIFSRLSQFMMNWK